MTHDELIAQTAARLKRHPADVDVIVAGVLETIGARIADDEPVTLAGFGVFALTRRAARIGKNPRTGAPIEYPASTSPRFTPDARLRALVRGEPSPPQPRSSNMPATDQQEDPMAKKKDAKKAKAKKSDKPKRKDAGKKKAAKAKAKKKSKKK